jgi:hypothetical protein
MDFYQRNPEKPKNDLIENLEKQQNEIIYDSITVRPAVTLGTTLASQELRQ